MTTPAPPAASGDVAQISVGNAAQISAGNVAQISAGNVTPTWLKFLQEINPGATYVLQAGISFSVILFSMIQLTRGEDAKVYLPVITGTAAYWLPNPKTIDVAKVIARAENDKKTAAIHDRLVANVV